MQVVTTLSEVMERFQASGASPKDGYIGDLDMFDGVCISALHVDDSYIAGVFYDDYDMDERYFYFFEEGHATANDALSAALHFLADDPDMIEAFKNNLQYDEGDDY